MTWLLKKDVAEAMQRERAVRGGKVTADERERWSAAVGDEKSVLDTPRIMVKAGKTAEIRVEGVLTKNRDIWAWLFYGANTSYREIQAALAAAESDPEIRDVVLYIDSPGGHVDGWFDCLGALESFSKTIRVRSAYACSAAYGIACAAGGKIEAVNAGSEFGSIGVAVMYIHDEAFIDITSTDAPDKRPDPTTEEGKAVIRKELDAIHELFADVVARGRGTTVKDVNENFGRGGVLIAKEAKKRGMIDSIAQPQGAQRRTAAAVGAAPQPRKKQMDESELKAQHPELHAAVFAKGKAEGKKEGSEEALTAERDRVEAHLTYGKECGALDTAIAAVLDGTDLTKTVMARYMTAGRNKVDREDRDKDASVASDATAGAEGQGGSAEVADLGDQIVSQLEAGKGQVKK